MNSSPPPPRASTESQKDVDAESPDNVITPEFMQCLEYAQCLHLARQVDACRILFPNGHFSTHYIAGGTAAVTLPELGQKLNNVVGFAAGSVKESDLQTLEQLYTNIGLPTVIDLCPFADATTLKLLASRGYGLFRYLNTYVHSLRDLSSLNTTRNTSPNGQSGPSVVISNVREHEHDLFIQRSVEGFVDIGRGDKVLETLAAIAVKRADTLLYFARVDDEIAATAAMALMETERGLIAYMYRDSTIPTHRRKGLQAALYHARLLDAKKKGCQMAVVVTQTGNPSGINAERLGFRVAYTRTLMRRGLE